MPLPPLRGMGVRYVGEVSVSGNETLHEEIEPGGERGARHPTAWLDARTRRGDEAGRSLLHRSLVDFEKTFIYCYLHVAAKVRGDLRVLNHGPPARGVCDRRVRFRFGFSIEAEGADESNRQVETRDCSGRVERRAARAH